MGVLIDDAKNQPRDPEAPVRYTFSPMADGQTGWELDQGTMPGCKPDYAEKFEPDPRTRYRRVMHRVLKRLWEWSEVLELYLHGQMGRFAWTGRQKPIGPFSVKITPVHSSGAYSSADGVIVRNDSRFHCLVCDWRFGVNDYDSNTVTCPRCGNTGIDTITDSLEGGG